MSFIFYFFYNVLLIVLLPLILAAIFFRYPKTFLKYFFAGIQMRLGQVESFNGEKPIWIHAASLGECKASQPLVQALRRQYPSSPIVFSSTTMSVQLSVLNAT